MGYVREILRLDRVVFHNRLIGEEPPWDLRRSKTAGLGHRVAGIIKAVIDIFYTVSEQGVLHSAERRYKKIEHPANFPDAVRAGLLQMCIPEVARCPVVDWLCFSVGAEGVDGAKFRVWIQSQGAG